MEQPKQEKHIEIQPLGSFFEIDNEGFLVNPASFEKIQEKWKPVIESYIETCKNIYGNDLVSVYLRGSVAKGQAIEGVSDLDGFVVLRSDYGEISDKDFFFHRDKIQKSFPFINGFDFSEYSKSAIESEGLLLSQSLYVFGNEVDVPQTKLSKDIAWHAPNFEKRHNKLLSFLEEKNPSQSRVKSLTEWLGKGILRTGLEILIERSGKYSRDLYPCYQLFSEYYPDKEPQMRAVLDLVLNSNTTQEKVREVLLPMSEFILQESKKVYKK